MFGVEYKEVNIVKLKNTTSNVDNGRAYLFDHFSLQVMMSDMRFSRNAFRPGQVIPDIAVTMDDGRKVSLYELAKDKPLLLVTASITCPMTISVLPLLKELQQNRGNKLHIAFVYVREAHPGENYPQPKTLEQKRCNALDFKNNYAIDAPVIIDELDGPLHKILDLKPNSVHLIGVNGKILLQSLWAGDKKILGDAIYKAVDGGSLSNTFSQSMLLPFFRGAGFMHETLKLAGDRSYKELMFGAPPIWLLSRLTSLFGFVPKKNRGGVSVMLLLGLLVLAGVYLAGI
ncbi:MAG: hypothetical protein AB9Q18_12340 [Candidatus Reddybacter sp.]